MSSGIAPDDGHYEQCPLPARPPALHGTLYERYYGLDYEAVLKLDDVKKMHGANTSPGFASMCRGLAGAPSRSNSVATNGTVIEQ